jgi:hypothetical protein
MELKRLSEVDGNTYSSYGAVFNSATHSALTNHFNTFQVEHDAIKSYSPSGRLVRLVTRQALALSLWGILTVLT